MKKRTSCANKEETTTGKRLSPICFRKRSNKYTDDNFVRSVVRVLIFRTTTNNVCDNLASPDFGETRARKCYKGTQLLAPMINV